MPAALIRILVVAIPLLLRPDRLWPILDLICHCKVRWICAKHQEILDRAKKI